MDKTTILEALDQARSYPKKLFAKHKSKGGIACGVPGCGKTYQSKFALIRHVEGHLQLKPFECSVCGKGFALK